MAFEVGVNLGFVIDTPIADPDEDDTIPVDGGIYACRHIAPPGAYQITELGWWQDDGSNDAANYNMGVYDDDTNTPGSLIATQESGQATTANTAGWYKYTGLTITVTPYTTYWIGLAIEAVAGANRLPLAGNPWCTGLAYHWGTGAPPTLSDPFVSGGSNENISFSIYAKYDAHLNLPLVGNRMGSGCNSMRA